MTHEITEKAYREAFELGVIRNALGLGLDHEITSKLLGISRATYFRRVAKICDIESNAYGFLEPIDLLEETL